MQVFAVLGYGVSDDIQHDENYQTYLRVAFNAMFDAAAGQPAVVVSSGGATNCTPPFKGTEAALIDAELKRIAKRSSVKSATKQWKFVREGESISTLENLLFLWDIMQQRRLGQKVTIFCEFTRQKRVQMLARKVIGAQARVTAIDFDHSAHRYADYRQRERKTLRRSLWALTSPEHLRIEHRFFAYKLTYLRDLQQREGISHVEALTRWLHDAGHIAKELGYGE